MMVETTKENICINEQIAKKNKVFTCESDFIIPDVKPDIVSTINTSGNICVYKKEVSNGKVRFDGCINVYIMYLADGTDSIVRGLNTTLDFNEIIELDEINENANIEEEFIIKIIDCKILNGRKINVNAQIELRINAYKNEKIDFITKVENIQDIQVLSKSQEVNSLIGTGTSKAYAKETIAIESGDNFAEILSVYTCFLDKDTKTSYNKVLAKTYFEIRILYLTEDNRICSVSSKIPVMGFIDIPEITDNSICDVNYNLKNIILKPNLAEEHSIYVEAEVELTCNAYENKQIEIIQDLYSPSKNLELSEKNIIIMNRKNNLQEIYNVKENVSIPEIENNKIYDVYATTNILNERIVDNKIIYDGELEIKFIISSNNSSGMDTKTVIIPFNYELNANNLISGFNAKTEVVVNREDFSKNLSEVHIDVELGFNVKLFKSEKINAIGNITLNEESNGQEYSMIVYYVKPLDTLWKIAKKFKSTVEDIAITNNIDDINKLEIGQQLFIPRYNYLKVC